MPRGRDEEPRPQRQRRRRRRRDFHDPPEPVPPVPPMPAAEPVPPPRATVHASDFEAESTGEDFDESLLSAEERAYAKANRMADERLAAARESLESDPNVQALKTMFGAELRTDSIEPLDTTRSD